MLLSNKYFVAATGCMANMPSSVPSKISWIDLIDEPVHTYDDVDIGDIDAVSRDFVVVKRGFVKIHYYYIPITKVEGWDGNVLWLKITEDEVKRNYERETIPDPLRYFVKDYPGYTAGYPELTVIRPKYSRPIYTAKDSTQGETRIYKCDLCSNTYRSEDQLSSHVASTH